MEPIPSEGAVLGIDIGFSTSRKSSAACLLAWTGEVVTWDVRRFRADASERDHCLAAVIGQRELDCVALDGPIRGDLTEIGIYRTAERLLTRKLQPQIGKPGQSSAPVGRQLNQHTNDAARAVLSLASVSAATHSCAIMDHAVVEAFPSSFLGLMLPEGDRESPGRGARSDAYFERLAARGRLDELCDMILPGRKLERPFTDVTNHDDRAGLVCALTALCVVSHSFTAVGDENGWIVLPPRHFIEPDLWALLSANGRLGSDIIVSEPGS